MKRRELFEILGCLTSILAILAALAGVIILANIRPIGWDRRDLIDLVWFAGFVGACVYGLVKAVMYILKRFEKNDK